MSKVLPVPPVSVTRAVVAAVAALAVMLGGWAAQAQATVINQEKYTDSFSDDFVDCGLALHDEFSISGTAHVRVGKGGLESAFFAHDKFRFHDTTTNPANGRFYTIDGNFVFNEIDATRVEGNVFEFTSVQAGTWILRNDSGDVVLRDRGVIRSTILFDTLGDGVPGGEFVEFISDEVKGPHPGFDLSEDEFCALTQELLG